MRVPQVQDGIVIGVYEFDVLDFTLMTGLVEGGEDANVGDIYDEVTGVFSPPPATPEPPRTVDEMAAIYVRVVQAELDRVAQAFGYDSLAVAVTYADEPAVARFQFEGRSLRAWRSLVWAACQAMLDDVKAGTIDVPTEAQLLASLPAAPVQAAQ